MRSLADAPRIEIEEITSPDALEVLRPEWSALWRRCPAVTPFQHPAWLLPWYRHFAAPNDLWVLALRSEGCLIGLAPLFVHRWEGRWQVSLLGTGVTDILDLLVEPEFAESGARAVLKHLARHGDRWDLCDFEQLPPGSPLLVAPLPSGIRADRFEHDLRLVVSLPASADEYVAALPKRKRESIQLSRNRLRRAGDARFETADEATLPEFLNALERLHTARWAERGGPGMLATPALRTFYYEVAGELLRAGMLRLLALRLEGAIAAVQFGFAGGGRASVYLTGFDPELARLGPGTLLTLHAIRQAIAEGCRCYDFLRGTEAYKITWGAREERNQRLRLWHGHSEPRLKQEQNAAP